MKMKIIVSALLFSLLYGCDRSLYIPASPDAAVQQQLAAGRELYTDNCGKCHRLHAPKEYTTAQWTEELEEMQPKAKITDEQRELIHLYLTSEPRSGN